jgi:hypothetical protein
MLHLFRQAVNPRLSLAGCIHNWPRISIHLREPPRKRRLQLDSILS